MLTRKYAGRQDRLRRRQDVKVKKERYAKYGGGYDI